jgi:SAM-dependent methyltransferase
VTARDEQLFALQETLYESRNPTRRTLHRQRRAWIVDAIERYGHGANKALEVGPGSGVYLPTLAAVARHVVASDIERAYLDRLEPLAQRHDNLRLVWDDITSSAFAAGEFDLVLCSEVVEHIADARPAFREMHRVLAPTGTLILSTPQRYSPLELASKIAFLPGVITLVRRVYREPIMETGHINLMTNRRLVGELRDAGFTPVEQWLAGMYLPVVAELFGARAVQLEAALERRLRGSRLQGLLWTQFVVARRGDANARCA